MSSLTALAFLAFLLAGIPVAFAFGLGGAFGLYQLGGAELLQIIPQELFRSLTSFPLLAIPLFVFAGSIMAQGGAAKRLITIADLTVNRGRGGLAGAVVVSTMLFSGISGSSTADTAAIGQVSLPMLKHQRYPLPFSVALFAASGCAALLIPPTLDLIIIGVVANISIAGLFAAGILPAILNGLSLIAVVVYTSRRKGYGGGGTAWSTRQFLLALLRALPAFSLMLAILGGILAGIFTPTEAAAVAVVYGLLLSLFVYRDLKLSMIPGIIRNTVQISGLVLLIIALGSVLTYAFTVGQVPQRLAAFLLTVSDSPYVFLILVQVFFLFLGMIMDTLPALFILMPILTPIARQLGIEPIHFGILVEANVAIGLITPPVGTVLYTACAIGGLRIEQVFKPLLPMIAVLVVTMLVITYVPEFSMWLPRLLRLTD